MKKERNKGIAQFDSSHSKNFTAPGIHLKDAIIFLFQHTPASLCYPPKNSFPTSYCIDLALGQMCDLWWSCGVLANMTKIHFQ